MGYLEDRLSEWTRNGLVTREQAQAIARHEANRSTSERASSESAGDSRRVAMAEAVGYVGAALALSAIGLLLGDVWPDLGTGGQLALVGLLTVLVAGAGSALRRQASASLLRLTGVLWTAAAIGGAWFAGIVASDLAGAGSAATGATVGAVGAAIGFAFLLLRPSLVLQGATLLGLGVAATSVLMLSDLTPDMRAEGALLSAIGGAWYLLGRGGWIAPRGPAEVLGGVMALIGCQVASFDDARSAGLALGLLLAAGLVGLAIRDEAGHLLIVGSLGLFVLMPQLVFEVFGDAIGAPATLLVVGLLLVLLAVGLGRARREVRGGETMPLTTRTAADVEGRR